MPLAIRIALLTILPTAALLAVSFWMVIGVVSRDTEGKTLAQAQARARQAAANWKQQGQQLVREAALLARLPAVARGQIASVPASPGMAVLLVDEEGQAAGAWRERDQSWEPIATFAPKEITDLDGTRFRFQSAALSEGGRLWLGQEIAPGPFELVPAGAPKKAGLLYAEVSLDNGWSIRVPIAEANGAEDIQDGIITVFGGAALGSVAAAALVAWILKRSVVTPLAKLADQFRRIERTGVLKAEFDAGSRTAEIQELARSYNRAATSVAESTRRLDSAYRAFIETMAQTLDARDLYTAGHSRRVSDYSVCIADQMRLSAEQIDVIRMGALLHDIGKVGVPDHVLQKPGALDEEEIEILRQHVTIGKRILEPCEGFQAYLPIVELHHENHDGTGYPWRLSGKEIPVEARIVHVADAYDAMTTDRPYRKGLPHATAIQRLRQFAGSQFDPEVIAAVDRMVAEGWRGVQHSGALTPSPSVFALARAIQEPETTFPVPAGDGAGSSGP